MNEEVKRNILAVLDKLLSILRTKDEKDILEIRELSNHVIHDATLFEDEDAISVAVLIYAISKIMQHLADRLEYREFITPLEHAAKELRVNDMQGFRSLLRKLVSIVAQKDSQINLYVQDVLDHARAKKGAAMCEHGISITKSAHLLNISQWELLKYLGQTTHSETFSNGHDIRTRLKYARELFS